MSDIPVVKLLEKLAYQIEVIKELVQNPAYMVPHTKQEAGWETSMATTLSNIIEELWIIHHTEKNSDMT